MRSTVAIFLVAVTLCLLSPYPVFAEEEEKQKVEKTTISISGGPAFVPKWLLALDSSKQPDGLFGYFTTFALVHHVDNAWSVGLRASFAETSGHGPFSHGGKFEFFGVKGLAIGDLRLRHFGLTVEGERRFRINRRFQPFVRLGVGIGAENAKFRGVFNGYHKDTGFPILDEPAFDRVTRIIPILNPAAGVRLQLPYQLEASLYGEFDTGYRVGFEFGRRFDFGW